MNFEEIMAPLGADTFLRDYLGQRPVHVQGSPDKFHDVMNWDVLNRLLATRPYVAGEDYSIADMAIWPWYGGLILGRAYNAAEFLDAQSYTHVMAWAEKIDARPAVKRGRIVNKTWGEPDEQLPERHSAADFAGKAV